MRRENMKELMPRVGMSKLCADDNDLQNLDGFLNAIFFKH